MSVEQIFSHPPSAEAEIEGLRAQILWLRAKVEALKFSESVQKTKADDFEAKYKALVVENQRVVHELQTTKAVNVTLAPMQEQHDVRHFATQMFGLSFNMLQLTQEILERIFPDDRTVRATLFGPTLRKMFEFVTRNLLPSHFFDSKDSIDIKVYSGADQFMEFASALTKFIYAGNMELPGCDFIVCGMDEPRKVQRVFSNDGTRIYEYIKFVVSFYCRDTKKKYKIVFSCDHGRTYPQEDFDINAITFDAIRGFDAWVRGSQIPVLQIIMGIMNRRAQWYRLPDAHFSGIERVLALRRTRMYNLYGCPFVTRTDFCPFLQDATKFALEFSGCLCNLDRCVSIEMLCGFFKNNLENSPLRCPFCKEFLLNLTHEPDCDPASLHFDLSCVEADLKPEKLRNLQDDGRSFPAIFGLEGSIDSEFDEIKEALQNLAKVRLSWSHLPELPELSEEEAGLFFRSNPDEDSDPEPEEEEPEVDDIDVQQLELDLGDMDDFQENWYDHEN